MPEVAEHNVGPFKTEDGRDKYLIRSVSDFFKVPEERRALCVKEFGDWHRMIAAVRNAGRIVSDALGVPAPVITSDLSTYEWIDDDLGMCGLVFRGPDGVVIGEAKINVNQAAA